MQHEQLSLRRLASLAVVAALSLSCTSAPHAHTPARLPNPPLPSWNDTPAKARILDFVATVTGRDSPRFVPQDRRMAVFDLDGTLIVERPDYVEVLVGQDIRPQVRLVAWTDLLDHAGWEKAPPPPGSPNRQDRSEGRQAGAVEPLAGALGGIPADSLPAVGPHNPKQ